MVFVAVRTIHAITLNRAIQRLLMPTHLRRPDWTDMYCGMIQHPTLPLTVLCLPEMETVPIHIEADGAELHSIMSVFVNDQAITQQEADGIVSAVQVMAGQQVRIADFIPVSWTANVFTAEQLAANGWLRTSILSA